MTTGNHSVPIQILLNTPAESMTFDEYDRALRSQRALHFGVDAEDIIISLYWRGVVEYERDPLGNICRVWLDKARNG